MTAETPPAADAEIRFRAGSWNVHRCIGLDGRSDPARIAAAIRELACDPIGLQEVDNSPGPSPTSMQLDYLAATTGMQPVAGLRIIRHRGHYGNALLTRRKVLAVRRHDLSVPRCEPRGLLDIELDVEGVPVRFFVTHLGLGPFERRHQIEKLLRLVRAVPETEPLVLLGDLNEWWPYGRLLRSLHTLFGRPPAAATFPARLPLLALDRIWVRPREAMLGFSVDRSTAARGASDHLPVVASLSLKRARASRAEELPAARAGAVP